MPPAAALLPGPAALRHFAQRLRQLLESQRGRAHLAVSAALTTLACLAALMPLALGGLAAPAVAAVEAGPGVSWKEAASDADIDASFAQARADARPLLLYWGASWCPPCNQLKATLFNRQDFIERSRAFVAVHVDGDAPGAQKLGTRFKVRGYPTLILFDPQGREITRLPGEVDAPQVMDVLQLGLAGGRPVRDVLADARAGKAIGANDWRLLAFYSWDTDEQQLVPAAERPAVLAALAAGAPSQPADVATRLWLKAQVARADAPPATAKTGSSAKTDPAAVRSRLEGLLADPAAARAQMDVLINFAGDLLKVAAPSAGPARQALVERYDAALQRLGQDASLSRADQVSTWIARVDLRVPPAADGASAPKPALPPALVDGLRAEVARHDREIRDGYERQAVITSAAYLLTQAGLVAESDALLQANLEKSHSPYYLMSALASNARKRGDTAAALRWYEEAWKRSVGPATRLQWGASYVTALVDLAPQDTARIEQAAGDLFGEAGTQSNAFYERSARSLQRAGGKLQGWGAQQQAARGPVLQRLQQRLDAVCGKLDANDPQRATCGSLLKPGAAAAHGAA